MLDKNSPALARLIDLISTFAGLKPSDLLTRKLSFILKGISEHELSQWVTSIANDPFKTELPALVEDLNNHETYFFREASQMNLLAEKLLPELIDRKIKERDFTINIWSAACSSGEEVYTLGMTVLQTFIKKNLSLKLRNGIILPPTGWQIKINGSDISRQVIRKSIEGIYETSDTGLSSFRNFPPEFMDYLTLINEYKDLLGKTKRIYQVNDVVKSLTKFEVFNLINPIPPVRNCDLILCRNVMIYLHENAQRHVQMVLRSALRPGGVIMMSAVDTMYDQVGMNVHNNLGCVYYEKK